ncbi:MAG: hypothetical protein AMXMBFR47_30770 [Planctomycetota bacterium]
MIPMIETVNTDRAKWNVYPGDDPTFLNFATKIIAAAAALAQHRHIVVVRIDNWFGQGWLGFPKLQFRHRRRPGGLWTTKKLRKPTWFIPPFHPHRVLSEARFEMSEDGIADGPFELSRPLHHSNGPSTRPRLTLHGERSFAEACEAGIYAWCSGNTRVNDRAALMVYNRSAEEVSGWYAEFRKVDSWRLSRRKGVNDADWRRMLEVSGVTK